MANAFDEFDAPAGGNAFDEFDAPAPKKSRTLGQTFKDLGVGVAQGSANLAGGLAEIPNLVTGGALDKFVVRPAQGALDRALGGTGEDAGGISGGIGRINEGLDSAKSDVLRQRQADLAQTKGILPTVGKLITDPVLLSQFAAEQVPILATLGAGTAGTASRAASAAAAKGAIPTAAALAGRKAAERNLIGASAALGGGFAGQSTIQDAMQQPDAVWDANPEFVSLAARIGRDEAKRELAIDAGQKAAAIAAPISAAAGRLTAPFEAGVFTRGATGVGLAGAISREATEEAIQEGGEQFAQNVGIRSDVDATRGPFEGVPESAAIGGTLGGIFGGGLYGASRLTQQPAQADPAVPPKPAGPLTRAALAAPSIVPGAPDPQAAADAQRAAAAADDAAAARDASREAEVERRSRFMDASNVEVGEADQTITLADPAGEKERTRRASVDGIEVGEAETITLEDPKGEKERTSRAGVEGIEVGEGEEITLEAEKLGEPKKGSVTVGDAYLSQLTPRERAVYEQNLERSNAERAQRRAEQPAEIRLPDGTPFKNKAGAEKARKNLEFPNDYEVKALGKNEYAITRKADGTQESAPKVATPSDGRSGDNASGSARTEPGATQRATDAGRRAADSGSARRTVADAGAPATVGVPQPESVSALTEGPNVPTSQDRQPDRAAPPTATGVPAADGAGTDAAGVPTRQAAEPGRAEPAAVADAAGPIRRPDGKPFANVTAANIARAQIPEAERGKFRVRQTEGGYEIARNDPNSDEQVNRTRTNADAADVQTPAPTPVAQGQAAEAASIDALSDDEVRKVYRRLNLAGGNQPAQAQRDTLRAEDAAEVRGAIERVKNPRFTMAEDGETTIAAEFARVMERANTNTNYTQNGERESQADDVAELEALLAEAGGDDKAKIRVLRGNGMRRPATTNTPTTPAAPADVTATTPEEQASKTPAEDAAQAPASERADYPSKARPAKNRAPSRNGQTASWVIRNKETGEVQLETFQPSVVQKINTAKYEAVAAQDHLAEINTPGTLAYRVVRGETTADIPANTAVAAEPAAPESPIASLGTFEGRIARQLRNIANEVETAGTQDGRRPLDVRWAEGAIKRWMEKENVKGELSGRQTGKLASAKIALGKDGLTVEKLREIAEKLEPANARADAATNSAPRTDAESTAQPAEKPAREASEKPAKPRGPRGEVFTDDRLTSETARANLRGMAGEAGWAEIGGRIIRSGEDANEFDIAMGRGGQSGEVVGRTPWVPKAPWFQAVQRDAGLPNNTGGGATMRAVDRALSGEPMGVAERRHVQAMLDWIDAEEAAWKAQVDAEVEQAFAPIDIPTLTAVVTDIDNEQGNDPADGVMDEALVEAARAKDEDAVQEAAERYDDDRQFMAAVRRILNGETDGQGADQTADGGQRRVPPPDEAQAAGQEARAEEVDPLLSSYTEDDLSARAEQERAAQEAEAEEARAAERKAAADREANDFVLTGSNRPADVAMARGQNSLFGASGDVTPAAAPEPAPPPPTPPTPPITAEDVAAAERIVRESMTKRIDAMKADAVQKIAAKFLPTMGVGVPIGKAKILAAATDFTTVNPLAAADAFGVPVTDRFIVRALEAKIEGAVAPAAPTSTRREESDQDRSYREWEENYDRVSSAPDLGAISITDLERAENYARNILATAWTKSPPLSKFLLDAYERSADDFRAELKRRRPAPASRAAPEFASFIAVAADSIGQLRQSDVDRVLSEAPSASRQGLATYIKQQRADLAGEVDEVMAELREETQPVAPPAWHTPLPAEGLPLSKGQRERKAGAYSDVPQMIAADAADAITQTQKLNQQPMYAYYLPASGPVNGIARLLPDDQTPPAPWAMLNGEAVRHAGMTRDQLVSKLRDWLRNAPVLGDEKATAPAPSQTEDERLSAMFPLGMVDRSYSGVSNSGTTRARTERDEFIKSVAEVREKAEKIAETDAQKAALNTAMAEYEKGYIEATERLARVRSETYSASIVGRSGLNARQANRRNDALTKAQERFVEWQQEARPKVRQAVLKARTPEQVAREAEAAQAEAKAKADKKEASQRALVEKLLNWKKGDKFRDYTIERVNLSPGERLPLSFTFSGEGIPPGSKIDVVKELLGGDRALLARLTREIREASGTDQAAPKPAEAAQTTAPAVGRSRPRETITFKSPITGPSGAKLVSYSWQWKPFEYIDSRGEERTKRVSDWSLSVESAETGREVVHQFNVEMPDGEQRTVSVESALNLLGFGAGTDGAGVRSVSSAAKTVARLRMQLAELQQTKAAFREAAKQINAMPRPAIERSEVTEAEGRAAVWWSMGDARVRQNWGDLTKIDPERQRALLDAWADKRLQEMGWTGRPERLSSDISNVEDRIAKAQKKLDALVAGQDAPAAEKPEPAKAAESAFKQIDDTIHDIQTGEATIEQYQSAFKRLIDDEAAVRQELNKKTKDELGKIVFMRPGDTKPDLVNRVYEAMQRQFALGKEYGPRSFMMGQHKQYEEAKAKALRALVEGQTAESLAEYAAEKKKAREEAASARAERMLAIQNPKTLDEFRGFVSLQMREGKTQREARLAMTPEQRAEFDRLLAESSRSGRRTQQEAAREVRVAGQKVDAQIIATKHTKKGHDLFVVRLAERVPTEDYNTLNTAAKRMGGYYSSFRGAGAVPGFQFTDQAVAEAFVKLANGDATAATEVAKERRDAFQDDRSQSAAERLTEMADRLEERADESLNADRKTNTSRRAAMASSAEASARADKALAKTMRNIAQAVTDGSAKFLDRVRQKVQVEMLESALRTAKDTELRAKYDNYGEQQKRKGEPATSDTVEFAEFPTFTAFRSDLATLAREMQANESSVIGRQLLKLADDVSAEYTKFAKENSYKVSPFAFKDGSSAIFANRDDAERAIKRSGLKGKAIVLPLGRGQNAIVMSPSEAQARGIWKGDGDKRITLSKEFGQELVEKLGKTNRNREKVRIPYQFESAATKLKALARMGIETPAEYRSALREFIALREQAQEADRVKEMERAMVGRNNDGLDFFPTPAETADAMVEAAEIEPDMAVLEPSAGMGHIADRIRAAGAEPDVIEMSGRRRELLEAKGYNLIGNDFTEIKPREFFTWGDVFRAPDGTIGVMRKSGGMGSNRVSLRTEDGNGNYYDREDLTPVEKRGTESGYDRIIMNPPFSEGRDMKHVRHAFDLLRPGGRIVAIMGEGAFFRDNQQARDFREWLESVGGTSEKLAEGTFQDPTLPVTTGVNARMVVIDKPTTAPEAAMSDDAASTDQNVQDVRALLDRGLGRAGVQQLIDSGVLSIVPNVDGLPSAARAWFRANPGKAAKGLYDPDTRRAYIVADMIEGPEAVSIVLHEVGEHYGLRDMLGTDGYAKLLDQVRNLSKFNPAVKGAWERVLRNYRRADGTPFFAEGSDAFVREVVAHMGERGDVNTPFWKRMIEGIRRFLFERGFRIQLNDADVVGMVTASLRKTMSAPMRQAQPMGGAVMAAVSDAARTLRQRMRDATGSDLARRAAQEFLNMPLTNADSGITATVSGQSLRKMLSESSTKGSVNPQAHMLAVANLDHLFAIALRRLSRDGSKTSDAGSVEAIHHFDAPMPMGDQVLRVKIMAKEFTGSANGTRLYLVQAVEIDAGVVGQDPGVSGQFRRGDAASQPPPGVSERFAQLAEAVKSSDPPAAMTSPPEFALADAAPGSFNAPEPSRLDDLLYTLQDKQIDLRRVTEAIKKSGRRIADENNAYLQEELYYGRTAKATQDFLDTELKPLLKSMGESGVTMDELQEYLHARHAPEANRVLAERNPDSPDGLSGMTTADAETYMRSLEPAKRSAFEAAAARVDAIVRETRQTLVGYGLESQETVDGWAGAYQNYVPLMREDMEGTPGSGQGFSVRGPATKMRTGSTRKVVDILANVAMQRERAIMRGEKNRVANALIGLAEANPNPDLWKVDEPPMEKYVDPRTGTVRRRVDPLYKSRPNVIIARVPTADGIKERSIVLNESDPRAQRMGAALKNLDMDQLGSLLGTSAKVTRYLASVNTQYNPVFGVVNLVRDVQGALFNLSTTPIAGKQAEVGKNVLSALRGIYVDARKLRSGAAATSPWAKEWEEFQKVGGQTGYRDMFRTSSDRADALKDEIERAAKGDKLKYGRAVFDWLSDYNLAMENAIRLSAYKVGKQNGMTKEQAASLAKNLTVNFNRKGQIAQQAGALYAFFNASAQGTARLAETIAGPAGRKIVTGGLLLGVAQALMLAAAFDEDEPPEFIRERNLVIPTGGGRYVSIPMPLGLHVLPSTSRILAEYAMNGFENTPKRAADLIGLYADAFNPVGNAGLSLQTVAPTVVDPFAALSENRDFAGRPIYREDFNKLAPTPGMSRASDTSTWIGQAVSTGLNYLSGGTEFAPGILSPTPDQIDYLIEQATGGVGREYSKLEQTVTSTITGEELPSYKVPLRGRFFGDTTGQSSEATAFYSNLRRINIHENEIKGRIEKRESALPYLRANPDARLIQAANRIEREVRELRNRKRQAMKNDAPRAVVERYDAQITMKMKLLNDRAKELRDAA